MAVSLRQVERISATLNSTQQDYTLSTTLLDTSKAFLVFGVRSASNTPTDCQVRGRILNTTTVRFERAGTANLSVVGYVAEFTSGVTVERGTFTNGLDEYAHDETLSSITDITKAWRTSCLAVSGSTYGPDDMWGSYLWNDGGTLKLRIQCAQTTLTAGSYVIDWQVIQYDDCSVQRGSITTMSASTADVAVSLSPSVDQSKSFLAFDFIMSTDLSGDIGAALLRGQINLDNQLTILRHHHGSLAIDDIRWECVEFTDSVTSQEVVVPYAASDGQDDATITEVSSLAAALAFASCNQRGGLGAYASDDIPGESWYTADLTSTTNLQTIRASTNSAANAAFYVIDFGAAPAGTTRNLIASIAGSSATSSMAAVLLRSVLAIITGVVDTSNISASLLCTLVATISNISITPNAKAAIIRALAASLTDSSAAAAVKATIARALGVDINGDSSTPSAAVTTLRTLAAAIAGQSITPDMTATILGIIELVAGIAGSGTTPDIVAATDRSLSAGVLGQSGTPAAAVSTVRAIFASIDGTSTTAGITASLASIISISAAVQGESVTADIAAEIARSLTAAITGSSSSDDISATAARQLMAGIAGSSTTPDDLILILAGLGVILDPSISNLTVRRTVSSLTVRRTIHST